MSDKYDKMSHFQNVNTLNSEPLQSLAEAIRGTVARTAETLGRDLLRARRLAEHGEWLPFLEAAGMHERTAQRLMQHVRTLDAGRREEVSLQRLLETEDDERDGLRARVAEFEETKKELAEELEARKTYPDGASRIAALDSELDALRSTEAHLRTDIAALRRHVHRLGGNARGMVQ